MSYPTARDRMSQVVTNQARAGGEPKDSPSPIDKIGPRSERRVTSYKNIEKRGERVAAEGNKNYGPHISRVAVLRVARWLACSDL